MTKGFQVSWIYAGTKVKMVGIQTAFVDISNNIDGIQYGFYNSAENLRGVQLGFINVAEKMKGIQIGLVNIIKKDGILPFMVFVNGSF